MEKTWRKAKLWRKCGENFPNSNLTIESVQSLLFSGKTRKCEKYKKAEPYDGFSSRILKSKASAGRLKGQTFVRKNSGPIEHKHPFYVYVS